MARVRADAPVTLSILDRLIDDDLKHTGVTYLTRAQSLRKLKEAVRRDLEWLLNTRHPVQAAPQGSQLADSLYMYGLPDITSLSVLSVNDRKYLTEAIKVSVMRFEPRITNVRVNLVTVSHDKIPSLRFVIEGLLRVNPHPEHVSFDTLLELSSGEYKVQGEFGAR